MKVLILLALCASTSFGWVLQTIYSNNTNCEGTVLEQSYYPDTCIEEGGQNGSENWYCDKKNKNVYLHQCEDQDCSADCFKMNWKAGECINEENSIYACMSQVANLTNGIFNKLKIKCATGYYGVDRYVGSNECEGYLSSRNYYPSNVCLQDFSVDGTYTYSFCDENGIAVTYRRCNSDCSVCDQGPIEHNDYCENGYEHWYCPTTK